MSESSAPWVTWLLIVAGWLVVNDQSNRRETRKELRSALDDLAEAIDAAQTAAAAYWTATVDAADASRALALTNALEEVERRVNRFVRRTALDLPVYAKRRRHLVDVSNSKVFIAYDDWASSATGGAFESASRVALLADDTTLRRMILGARHLLDQLELTYDAFCGLKARQSN